MDEYWGEEGEPVEGRAKKIIVWGPRQSYEMEQVFPMDDPDDPDGDPIVRSNDLKNAGHSTAASWILMELCEVDFRCLDAHSHLGNMVFEDDPAKALRHYEVGMRIGELSLDGVGDDVLPWDWIDNRPWLRCLNGFGLCLWRLGQFKEASACLTAFSGSTPRTIKGCASVLKRFKREENGYQNDATGRPQALISVRLAREFKFCSPPVHYLYCSADSEGRSHGLCGVALPNKYRDWPV